MTSKPDPDGECCTFFGSSDDKLTTTVPKDFLFVAFVFVATVLCFWVTVLNLALEMSNRGCFDDVPFAPGRRAL